MKLLRPIPLAVLWIGSLALTVAATRGLRSDAPEVTGSGAASAKAAAPAKSIRPTRMDPQYAAPAAAGDALREPDPLARAAGVAEMLPQLTGDNALEVLDAYRNVQKEKGTGLAFEGELILLQVGRTAGLAALERERPMDPASPNVPAQFDVVMRGFAGTDPGGALSYWRSLADGPFKNSLKSGLLTGLAENNSALARDFFASLPPAEQVGQIPHLAHQINRHEGAKALQNWFDGVAEDPLHPTVKWTLFHAVAEELQQSPAANADFMTREASKPHAASDIYNQYAVAWTDTAPTAALDWAARLPAPEGTTVRSDTLNTVISRWTADDAGGVGDWLNSNVASPYYDDVAAGYVQQLSILDPAAATQWTSTIRNAELRALMTARLGGIAAVVP